VEAEFEAEALEEIAGPAGVAGGAPADADGVFALRFEIEEGVERGHAVYLGQGDVCPFRDVFEGLGRKVFMRVPLLQLLEDAEEGARAAGVFGNGAVGKGLIVRLEGDR
jgi:hypothetical protein